MRKWVIGAVMLLLTAVFVVSGIKVAGILHQYKAEQEFYKDTADRFTFEKSDDRDIPADENPEKEDNVNQEESSEEQSPFSVDFQGLQEINEDVCAWIYCEETEINYPVVIGEDNDYYLRHNYDGSYAAAGSIFADKSNRSDFGDANTILYAHNMKDGSMFANLLKWADQSYYEEHPVMWLMTPKQDYKMVLIAGYITSFDSDAYTIYREPGEQMDAYLDNCIRQSDFRTDAELIPEARYVMLSTCTNVDDNERYVLHGMLVPVGSENK